jgi:hypothetical protein
VVAVSNSPCIFNAIGHWLIAVLDMDRLLYSLGSLVRMLTAQGQDAHWTGGNGTTHQLAFYVGRDRPDDWSSIKRPYENTAAMSN